MRKNQQRMIETAANLVAAAANHKTLKNEKMNKTFCTKKIKTETGTVENSYLCDQPRFTTASMWNVLKQKKDIQKRPINTKP